MILRIQEDKTMTDVQGMITITIITLLGSCIDSIADIIFTIL